MQQQVTLTMKELNRYSIIQSLIERNMTNNQAAANLSLSKRQIIRLKKKVKEQGVKGVIHGNKGRQPAHAFSSEFKKHIIELAEIRYFDFNFSHMAEMLLDHEDIRVNRETLRQWLRPYGFGSKVRKVKMHRKRRKRSPKEGYMLFLDGSPHCWFGNELSTLILATDDATGKPLWGCFQPQEDLNGCFAVCQKVFEKYGLPVCFYLDKASQFTTTRHGGLHVVQSDKKPTHFERAMAELGIGLIFANSPQARGRGERINGVFQDRLVAELRLNRIKSVQQATVYLNEVFIPSYIKRFGQTPEDPVPAWRALPESMNILNILCRRFQRTVKNDNTISVNGTQLQLLPTRSRLHFAKAKVRVNLWVDGTWHVFHPRKGEIPCEVISWKKSKSYESLFPSEEPSTIWLPPKPRSFTRGDIFTLQKR